MGVLSWIGMAMMSIGLSFFLISNLEDYTFFIRFLLLAGVILFVIGFYYPKKK